MGEGCLEGGEGSWVGGRDKNSVLVDITAVDGEWMPMLPK